MTPPIRTAFLLTGSACLLLSLTTLLTSLHQPYAFTVPNTDLTTSNWGPLFFWPPLCFGLFTLYFGLGGKP